MMWMMPLHLHVNKKSDYDDDDDREIVKRGLNVDILKTILCTYYVKYGII